MKHGTASSSQLKARASIPGLSTDCQTCCMHSVAVLPYISETTFGSATAVDIICTAASSLW